MNWQNVLSLKYEVLDHGLNPLGILSSFLGLLDFLSILEILGVMVYIMFALNLPSITRSHNFIV